MFLAIAHTVVEVVDCCKAMLY